MKRKTVFALMASAAAVCCVFAFTACKDDGDEQDGEITYGETIQGSDFNYREIKRGSNTIAYSVSGADDKEYTDITIPSSYNGKPVTEIDRNAFYQDSTLTGVTIPDSVTTIGNFAFYYCNKLSTVSISNGVNLIGESAFSSCSSLTEIQIPSSVTVIGNGAFRYCGLTSINLPEGLKEIAKKHFIDALLKPAVLISLQASALSAKRLSAAARLILTA
ncbi:MAG: leucine-rich repeat domain-containing protein [Clostridia bacterium]|nr:leucine-rich repeat domain-containing protein [Clostridia bacterium]